MLYCFCFLNLLQNTLRSTKPAALWVPGALSPGVKMARIEADHSPPSSAQVNNAWSYTISTQKYWRSDFLELCYGLEIFFRRTYFIPLYRYYRYNITEVHVTEEILYIFCKF
jgi:hypothetical protein